MGKFTETSLLLNLWCVALYAILTIVGWCSNVTNSPYYLTHRNHKIQESFLFFGFLIYSMTYWINSDFFGYIEYAEASNTNFRFDLLAPMEYGHQIICSIVDGSWIGFRFFCWGGSLVLYVLTAKKLQINVLNSLFILFACFSNVFSYGRVTLAMASYFYGIACIIRPGNVKIWSNICGLFFVLCSFLFHSSALLMIALTPIAFLPKKFSGISKTTIICFVVMMIVISSSIDIIYSGSMSLDDQTSAKLNHYAEKETGSANLWGIVSATLTYTGQYLPVYLVLKYANIKKELIRPYIGKLIIITCIIAFLSVAFYFSGDGQFVLFYRTLNMAMLPTCLLISYFYVNGIFDKKTYYWAIAFGFVSIIQKYAWTILKDL